MHRCGWDLFLGGFNRAIGWKLGIISALSRLEGNGLLIQLQFCFPGLA